MVKNFFARKSNSNVFTLKSDQKCFHDKKFEVLQRKVLAILRLVFWLSSF